MHTINADMKIYVLDPFQQRFQFGSVTRCAIFHFLSRALGLHNINHSRHPKTHLSSMRRLRLISAFLFAGRENPSQENGCHLGAGAIYGVLVHLVLALQYISRFDKLSWIAYNRHGYENPSSRCMSE